MAVRGLDNPHDLNGKKKNNRNKILLAALAALALLSLFVLLGNPGIWTPDETDEPEAEATDNTGDAPLSNNTEAEPATNSSQLGTVSTDFNETAQNFGGNDDATFNNGGSNYASGYVISYGGPSTNSSSGSGGGGGGARGGGGGGGGGGGSNDDDNNSNNTPVALDQAISMDEDTLASFTVQSTDADGDEIDYSLVTIPTNGIIQSFNSTTGALEYAPSVNFNGSDSFEFRATDSHGADDTGIISITVNPLEDAPLVSNSTSATTDEDQPVNIDLNQIVSDPDGSGSVISIVNLTLPANGSVVLHSNNTVKYTPEPNFNGQDAFSFQASDGSLVSNVADVTITVNPVNDTPFAQNVTLSTPEDTPVDIVLINYSSDVDGDVSELVVTQLPSSGIITISPDNSTVTYSPNENFNGDDSFEYVISDGTSNSTGTVEITVTPVNDDPVIVDGALGSVTVEEDGSTVIDIISNVFDPEGDTVTITNVTQPAHGDVTLNPDGTMTYTPDPDYNGQDSFDFTVEDGNGGSATGTVTITITPVNDVPQAIDTSASGDEDTTSTFGLNATDSDGDSLTFTLVSPPQHGTAVMIDAGAGIVEYTSGANYNGPDSVAFQATDGTADSEIATLSITVNPINDDPVANDDNFIGSEDTPLDLDVLADDTDIDGDGLAVEEIANDPSHGIAAINPDGSITYTAELDFNGTDSFEYKINDGNGGSDTATVTITIGAVNDAPNADDGSVSVQEDGTVDIILNSTDSDGDSIQFSIVSQPSHGTLEVIVPDGSMVRYTPSSDYNGNDEFKFQTTDGFEDSNIGTVTLTVEPVNDDPVANDDNVMGQEDIAFGGNILANDLDIDGDSLAVVNSTLPSSGNLTISADGSFSYTPQSEFSGVDSFQYLATDGNGGFATATVMLTVAQVNDAPIANDDSAYTTLSQPVLVKVLENDSDIDGANLNVGSVSSASHGTVTIRPDGKGVIYTPFDGYSGDDQFTYTVTDGSLSDTATVTIKVYNIKFGHIQPPVGGGGDHEFEQGNTASVRLKLQDASANDIVDAIVILRVQHLDENNQPIGTAFNATSAGGSSDGNVFSYSNSWYQYNLKTEDMTLGKWALYVYLIDTTSDPIVEVLLEDQPIDGISTTILIK